MSYGNTRPLLGARPNMLHRLSTDLVLCLPFNEGTGSRANDLSGRDNYGTNYGTTWIPGPDGDALRFVTADQDYVGVRNSYETSLRGECYTITAWANVIDEPGANKYSCLYGTGLSYQEGKIAIGTRHSINQMLVKMDNQAAVVWVTELNYGQWYQLAYTMNQNTEKVQFYKDGQYLGEQSFTSFSPLSGLPRIGFPWFTNNAADFITADVKAIMIHNRILSRSEIAWLHREPYAYYKGCKIPLSVFYANFVGKRAYPIDPEMGQQQDGGPVTFNPQTGLPRGGPAFPYNANVRGLSKRIDRPVKS